MCKKLYHYTCWNGLEGILNKKGLLLNCVTNVKDNEEVGGICQIIKKHLDCYKKTEEDLMRALGRRLREKLESVVSDVRNKTYVTCFCKKSDNKCLWKNYAHNHHGLELEIEFDEPQIISRPYSFLQAPESIDWIDFIEMSYDNEELITHIGGVLSLDQNNKNLKGGDFLHAIASYHKNNIYEQEQEIRLAYYRRNENQALPMYIDPNCTINDIINQPDFTGQQRNKEIFGYIAKPMQPYYSLFSTQGNCKLKSIKIGKNSNVSKDVVYNILQNQGFGKYLESITIEKQHPILP